MVCKCPPTECRGVGIYDCRRERLQLDEYGQRLAAHFDERIAAIKSELEACGLMLVYHDPGVPTVAVWPGRAALIKKTFGL